MFLLHVAFVSLNLMLVAKDLVESK